MLENTRFFKDSGHFRELLGGAVLILVLVPMPALGAALLVKDINPSGGTTPASPSLLTNVNGTLFFRAYDDVHGYELWKTDGTAMGTVLVKDINPGIADSSPYGLTNINGKLYFGANDGVNGEEIWKSDGTPAGTVLVKDIRAGAADSVHTLCGGCFRLWR